MEDNHLASAAISLNLFLTIVIMNLDINKHSIYTFHVDHGIIYAVVTPPRY